MLSVVIALRTSRGHGSSPQPIYGGLPEDAPLGKPEGTAVSRLSHPSRYYCLENHRYARQSPWLLSILGLSSKRVFLQISRAPHKYVSGATCHT